ADDPLEEREPVVLVILHAAEQRLREAAKHAVPPPLQHYVEFEMISLCRLERRRGDRIRVGDRAALLPPLGVEVGDKAHLVPFLHFPGEETVVPAQRDVLAGLVGGKLRAVDSHQTEQRQAGRKPVPLHDASGCQVRHDLVGLEYVGRFEAFRSANSATPDGTYRPPDRTLRIACTRSETPKLLHTYPAAPAANACSTCCAAPNMVSAMRGSDGRLRCTSRRKMS